MTPPLAPGTEPTVIFGACEAACDAAGLDVVDERTSKLFVRYNGVKNNGVKAAFKTAGFRTVLNKASEGYNAVWNGCLKNEDLKRVNRYQRVNHFPGTWEVGRKDRLSRNIGKARRRTQGSDDFDIHPRSFVLPADSDDWRIECDRYPDGLYIIKPPASSRGRGIKMMRRPSDIKPDKDYLIQRYIRDPHLIDGYKYDIRVYVAVTCLDPLRVYAYREGLVRLATERYTNDGVDLNKRCMHLTNYSVNSKKEAFTMGETAEDDDVGFKWSLSALRRHFDDNGLDFESTWARMKDVIVKTMIAVESPMNTKSKMFVPDRRICYEIFGFDIMLDSRLTPWLIEVNTGPSLSAPSKLDMHVKHRMLANLFNLVGVTPYDRAKFKAIEAGKRRARLTGVPEPRSDPRVGRATIDIASAKVGSSSWRGKPSGGGNPAAAANAFPKRKDVKALNGVCFDHFTTAELPEVIRESDAELGRAQEFERCFPASSPRLNDKYMALFEAPRFDNALLVKWEAHKHKLRRNHARGASGRSLSSAGSSRSGGSGGGRSLSRQGRASTPTEFGGGQHEALGGERYVRGRAQPRTAAAAAAGAPAPDGGRAATVSAVSSARGGVRGGALRGAQPQPRGDSPARPFGAVGRPGGSFARVGAGVGAGVVDLDLGASLASTLTLGGARAGRPGRGGDGGDGGGGGVAFGSTRGGGKGGLGKGSGREKAPSFFVGPPR